MKRNFAKKLLCAVISTAMVVGAVPVSAGIGFAAGGETLIGDEVLAMGEERTLSENFATVGGSYERLFATIDGVTDSQVTAVKYQKEGEEEQSLSGDDFTFLVRDDGHYNAEGQYVDDGRVRLDITGLSAGSYSLKVEAGDEVYTAEDLEVLPYDRSGYAHFNYSNGVGAYNNDGSLKKNAMVVYVTDENKNTVKLTYGDKSATGVGKILTNSGLMKKLAENGVPLVIRFIGTVSDSGMYRRSTEDDKYDQSQAVKINGLDSYKETSEKSGYETNGHMASIQCAKDLTLEGIGTNAVIDGWGVDLSGNNGNGKSFEVRNLTFINTAEDAIGMGGGNITNKAVEHCWIHNNSFYCPKLLKSSDMFDKDKYEGDGTIDFKWGQYLTVAYNHFYATHKTSLLGGGDSQYQMNITYHHNYFDGSVSRLPLVRRGNVHMYNNIFANNVTSTINPGANAYVFAEYNIFKNAIAPKLRNDTAVIKGYSNWLHDTDAGAITEVSDKTAKVKNNCECGGVDYSSFDTDEKLSYIPGGDYILHTEEQAVKNEVEKYSGATRDMMKNAAGEYILVPVTPDGEPVVDIKPGTSSSVKRSSSSSSIKSSSSSSSGSGDGKTEDGSSSVNDKDISSSSSEAAAETPVVEAVVTKSGEAVPSKSKETPIAEKSETDSAEHYVSVETVNFYTGAKIIPEIDFTVKTADGTVYERSQLSKKDYKIIYKNNKNANKQYDAATKTFSDTGVRPCAIITYKGALKGIASDTVYFDIYPASLDEVEVLAKVKADTITVKAGKKLKFYKKAVYQPDGGKKRTLNRKKDIVPESIRLVPLVDGQPDIKAEGIKENALAAANMSGEYALVITGQGNYYSTMWSNKVILKVVE